MTHATPLTFPNSRVLAGWWRQLTPFAPRRLWVGHYHFYQIEALAEVRRPVLLDPTDRVLLQALTLTPAAATAAELDERLRLGAAVLFQLLRRLAAAGLVQQPAAESWELTPAGRQALEQGEYTFAGRERRSFHFVERLGDGAGPRFLTAAPLPGLAWSAAEGRPFDLGLLDEGLRRPEEWKRRHGFPQEVQSLLGRERVAEGQVPDWRQVILNRQDQVPIVLAQVAGTGGVAGLAGFAVRQEGWVLHAAEPTFTLGEGWAEVFPELAEAPPAEAWRQAWRGWCQPRNLPAAECQASTPEQNEHRLQVRVPRALLQRLQAARSDAVKGEAWVLAATDNPRAAAVIELVEDAVG